MCIQGLVYFSPLLNFFSFFHSFTCAWFPFAFAGPSSFSNPLKLGSLGATSVSWRPYASHSIPLLPWKISITPTYSHPLTLTKTYLVSSKQEYPISCFHLLCISETSNLHIYNQTHDLLHPPQVESFFTSSHDFLLKNTTINPKAQA
jgi:hypothetical protein